MWDMSNYYENLSRPLLVERAMSMQFPAVILRVATAMYATKRTVSLSGIIEEVGFPARGIVA
eukprot:6776104-Alexandrium_andersonii.AAC.1